MQVKTTEIEGLLEVFPSVYEDNRGWFHEFYKEDAFHNHGVETQFVQENISFSKKGVIRGLHLQLPPFEQAKIVTVISGKVLDVVVDLRSESKTFGKTYYCLLEAIRHNILVIPAGFAHGFAAYEDSVFFYKCSSFYNREAETGVIWNDSSLKIDWGVKDPIISEKDGLLPTLDELLIKSVISR